MHSYLANKAQPYALSHYSIFVAEVASTFNESLLLEHMLEMETRDEIRLSLLGNYLDNARATVFRQVQFAEFELNIHKTAEEGTALTGDLLHSMYAAITREYCGHDKGVCIVDDEIQAEWTYIPHFYYNFYVYQYATSFTASTAILERVLAGEDGAIAKLSGSSCIRRIGLSDRAAEKDWRGHDHVPSTRRHHGSHEQDHGRN